MQFSTASEFTHGKIIINVSKRFFPVGPRSQEHRLHSFPSPDQRHRAQRNVCVTTFTSDTQRGLFIFH